MGAVVERWGFLRIGFPFSPVTWLSSAPWLCTRLRASSRPVSGRFFPGSLCPAQAGWDGGMGGERGGGGRNRGRGKKRGEGEKSLEGRVSLCAAIALENERYGTSTGEPVPSSLGTRQP